MNTSISQQIPPTDLSRRVAVFPALKQPSANKSHVWIFDSPKNNKRFAIKTHPAFMHSVLAEGDLSIAAYDAAPAARRFPVDGEQVELDVDAIAYRRDGSTEWWDFRSTKPTARTAKADAAQANQKSLLERAAGDAGATYVIKTPRDLIGKEILFDNWLMLCAAITRCRGRFLGREAEEFAHRLSLQQAVTLGNLLAIPQIDVALMLAVVANALQKGVIHTDLTSQLFGPLSFLSGVKS